VALICHSVLLLGGETVAAASCLRTSPGKGLWRAETSSEGSWLGCMLGWGSGSMMECTGFYLEFLEQERVP
jgi:hypothetical protein